jgi:hypothetical protein
MNKKIKLLTIISLLFSIYSTYAKIDNTQLELNPIYNQLDSNLFVEVTADIKPFITENEQTKELVTGYNITYNVTESTAYNNEGEKIEGEIVQHVYFDDNSKRAYPQRVKIKYQKNEPLIYHYKNLLRYDAYFSSHYNHEAVIN